MTIKYHAKLNSFSRSPRGFFAKLEIGPDDDWEDLAKAPLNSAFYVVMVPIDPATGEMLGETIEASPGEDVREPLVTSTGQQRIEAGKIRKPFSQMSRAQQAGILSNDPAFGLWLSNKYPNSAPDVAEAVRRICGVSSRSELSEDRVAGKKWDQLVTDFYQATGRLAEVRG